MTTKRYLSVSERELLYEEAIDRLFARYGAQELSDASRDVVNAAMKEVATRRRIRASYYRGTA